MEINSANNELDLIVQSQANLEILLDKKDTEETTIAEMLTDSVEDSYSAESFQKLKSQVANAHQPGRAEYIAGLKEAIAKGEYSVDANAIASGMVRDGFLNLLT